MRMISLLFVMTFLLACSAAPLDKAYHALSTTGSIVALDDSTQSFWYIGSNKWSAEDGKHGGKENLMFYIRFNLTEIIRKWQ